MPDGNSQIETDRPGERGEVRRQFEKYLRLPEKVNHDGKNTLGLDVANFLADKGVIKKVDVWRGSWGFKWESDEQTIYHSERPMPKEMYDRYIIQLGKDNTGKAIFPLPEDTDQYRFLHEVSHAYQDYLADKEGGSETWHTRAVNGEVDSNFAILFSYCYNKRSENPAKGLSTWGSQSDYEGIRDVRSRSALAALEDANELVTAYLWSPKYFETYLAYLAGEYPGYGDQDLDHDRLIRISRGEKEALAELVVDYVKAAKLEVSRNKAESS